MFFRITKRLERKMIMSVKEYGRITFCVIGNSEKENVKAIKKEFIEWDIEQDRGHGFAWDSEEIWHRTVQIGNVEII